VVWDGWAPNFFEVPEDKEGEYYHLVTLWKSNRKEQEPYGEYS
jgi:hypothetical protein